MMMLMIVSPCDGRPVTDGDLEGGESDNDVDYLHFSEFCCSTRYDYLLLLQIVSIAVRAKTYLLEVTIMISYLMATLK